MDRRRGPEFCNLKLSSVQSFRRGSGPWAWGPEGSCPPPHFPLLTSSRTRLPVAQAGVRGIFYKQQSCPSAAACPLYLKVMSSVGGNRNTPIQPPQGYVLRNTDTGLIVPKVFPPSASSRERVGPARAIRGGENHNWP